MTEPKMRRPGWKNEININTLLMVAMLVGTGIGWGVTWQTQVAGQKRNNERIDQAMSQIVEVRGDLRHAIVELNGSMKTYTDLPYRVNVLEAQVATMTGQQRDLERALSQLASDMRVTREIVERLDPARRRTFPNE